MRVCEGDFKGNSIASALEFVEFGFESIELIPLSLTLDFGSIEFDAFPDAFCESIAYPCRVRRWMSPRKKFISTFLYKTNNEKTRFRIVVRVVPSCDQIGMTPLGADIQRLTTKYPAVTARLRIPRFVFGLRNNVIHRVSEEFLQLAHRKMQPTL